MKRLVTLIITTLLLTGCVSTVPEKNNESIQYPIQTEKKTTTTEQITTPSTQYNPKEELNNEIHAGSEEPVEMTHLVVDGQLYEMPYIEGQSVYTAMQFLMAASSRPFYFQAKEYPGLGFFVYEINGKVQENKTGTYWIYYINGQSAKIGISNYIIQQGDIIEWKYEKSTF